MVETNWDSPEIKALTTYSPAKRLEATSGCIMEDVPVNADELCEWLLWCVSIDKKMRSNRTWNTYPTPFGNQVIGWEPITRNHRR